MMSKAIGWIGVIAAAAFGATVATWAQAPYPISITERTVLTPTVKPGDKARVELVVDRRSRCDQIISKFIQYPDGTRDRSSRDLPSEYGRMGRDVYVLEIQTKPDTPFGKAEIYSTGRAECNPWQTYIKAVESGDPWRDEFRFGPETVHRPGKHEQEAREARN